MKNNSPSKVQVDADIAEIMDAAPIAMLIFDMNGKIVLCTRLAEEIFEYSKAEFLSLSLKEIIPDRFLEQYTSDGDKVAMMQVANICARKKDGTEFPIEIGLSPVKISEGTYIISSIVDISKRKRYENELKRSNEELDRFAYVVSHNLRAPLRAIDNLAKWIDEDLEDTLQGEAKENMTLLRNRVSRLSNLLEKILDYSRVDRKELAYEEVEVKDLLNNLIETLDVKEGFSIEIAENMPRFITPKIALQQVFLNLLSNALKHHNGKTGTIKIDVEEKQSLYLFTVTDDGPGISEDRFVKIFEMFQGSPHQSDTEIHGMGLAITKKIVHSHNGLIWVESSPQGRKTLFKFTWPKVL